MEPYNNKKVGDITYLSELTLDILNLLLRNKMSRVKFAHIILDKLVKDYALI